MAPEAIDEGRELGVGPAVDEGAALGYTVKPEVLKQYEGTYYSEELETICRLEVEDGRLKVIHPRFDPAVLKGSEKDRFTGDQWYLREARFERDAGGRVVEMVVTAGRVRDLRFIRQE